jgi:N-methylhydantoinase A
MGALLTDVKRDYIRSLRRRLDTSPEQAKELRAVLDELEKQALAWVEGEGDIVGVTELSWSAEMRYKDQAYDLDVPIPSEVRQSLAGDNLAELFHQAHQRVYGFPDRESPVELTAMRTRVIGRVPAIRMPEVESSTEPPRPIGSRKVYSGRGWRDVLVYERGCLRAGQHFAGPAIVEQEDTTTVILAGWGAEVDSFGMLNIHRSEGAH